MEWYFKTWKLQELLIELNKLRMVNTPISDQKKRQKDGLKSEELKKLNESTLNLLKMKQN